MALHREEWLLLLGLWLLELSITSTNSNDLSPDNTTFTASYPFPSSSSSAPSSSSSQSSSVVTSGDELMKNVTWGATTAPPDDVTMGLRVTHMSLCDIDVTSKEAHCDAGQMLELPLVDLPDNITRLVVTRGSISAGGKFLGRALNDNNFTSLRNLERLTINNFGLSQLQNSTFAVLPYLEYLDLSYNRIQSLQDVTFVGLSKLTTLNLSHNEISTIQSEFFNLPSLQHLVLSYNHITVLPSGAVKFLPVLQSLTLDGNSLGSLTSGSAFLGLDHLRELRLVGCNLHIPHSLFDHTQSVDTLYLAHNGLQNIPTEALSQLYFLQTLDMSHNKLTSLPSEAFQGLALRVLDLSNNSISKIAKQAFRNFRTEELYLQNNLIRGIPMEALESFARNLFVLDLSGNQLEQSKVVFPEELAYLHTLNLSSSGLTHIPYSLSYLYQLHTLDISNNSISSLNESGTRILRRLEAVSLQANPWNCDCSIVHLRDWLKHREEQLSAAAKSSSLAPPGVNTSSLICSRPDVLSGTPVVAIPARRLARCSPGWIGAAPVAISVICGLVVVGVVGLVFFMWRKRHEMGYGRFCGEKGGDDSRGEPHSPIKVISNAGAGAEELPTRHQGPIKNHAWESALVISNPHSGQRGDKSSTHEEPPVANGKVPGAETIV